ANGGYTVEQAVWAARRMEDLGVALFEQPTRRGDHAAMADVRRKSGIPIMADESVFTPLDALEVIRHQAADVLSLYPGKHSGIRGRQALPVEGHSPTQHLHPGVATFGQLVMRRNVERSQIEGHVLVYLQRAVLPVTRSDQLQPFAVVSLWKSLLLVARAETL